MKIIHLCFIWSLPGNPWKKCPVLGFCLTFRRLRLLFHFWTRCWFFGAPASHFNRVTIYKSYVYKGGAWSQRSLLCVHHREYTWSGPIPTFLYSSSLLSLLRERKSHYFLGDWTSTKGSSAQILLKGWKLWNIWYDQIHKCEMWKSTVW